MDSNRPLLQLPMCCSLPNCARSNPVSRRQMGMRKKMRSGGWWPHGLPQWERVVSAVRHYHEKASLRQQLSPLTLRPHPDTQQQHRFNASSARTTGSNVHPMSVHALSVHGCGAPGGVVPGDKGGDTCYWTLASNDDLLAEELSRIATPFSEIYGTPTRAACCGYCCSATF